MKYLVSNTSALEIVHNNSSSTANITIQLGIRRPIVTVTESTYIAGVYGNDGTKNPGLPYCEVDEKTPNFTDNNVAVSTTTTNQITLNLDTNLMQI
jgi:hypothetical protein